MVLVFYTNPEAPPQCAVQISRALNERPRLQLRMGIHSGPVSGIVDVNERANLAGAGINMAKRVMDCGDAGTSSFLSMSPKISKNKRSGDCFCTISAHAKRNMVCASRS
jgi:hypothetical protein